MKNTLITAAVALAIASTTAVAAPSIEVQVLGGQITAPSHFRVDNDNVTGATNVVDRVERELGANSKNVSADFAPGLRLGVRLGDSPVIVQVGARQSDHLDLSYDAGVRYSAIGSKLGAEARVVRFDETVVRDAFGGSIEGEALVTYDVAKYLRLGAGVSTATLSSSDVTGLVTADLVFKFGSQSVDAAIAPIVDFVKPTTAPVVAPIEEVTGERG
jgi:hypothetical protein